MSVPQWFGCPHANEKCGSFYGSVSLSVQSCCTMEVIIIKRNCFQEKGLEVHLAIISL